VLTIRVLTIADIPFGMEMKQQAGWNQLEADWLRFLAMERAGCFLAEWNGQPVGTVATCVFGGVGWIAMMLVEASYRGKGIGRSLMTQAMAYLTSRGVSTMRLDATPMGQPLYEKLGFVPQFQLIRFEGVIPRATPNRVVLEKVRPDQLPDLIRFDETITGTNRRIMLQRFYEEYPEWFCQVRIGNQLEGFLAARPGANACQIGPCLANPNAGELLFAQAQCQFVDKRVFIDVPVENEQASAQARKMGLHPNRYLLRMLRGAPVVEKVDHLWASSGPEKG
jgi:GNAT superfamily N-acetyltransferase